MRIQHRYLTFQRNDRLTKLLDELAVRYIVKEKSYDERTHFYSLEFYLYEDNPGFTQLQTAVKKFDIEPQIGTIYEKEELAKANWFWVSIRQSQYPQPENDFGYLRMTFDLDHYCPTCGIGKVQNAPFRLKTQPKQSHSQFWGLHWEFDAIFVRPEAKRIFEQENIVGISFSNPVLHKNNIQIDSLFQMHTNTVLDAGFDNYNAQQVTCKYMNEEDVILPEKWRAPIDANFCGRIKYNFPRRGGLTFQENIFANMPDIVKSNEYFGSGAKAFRLPIFSKKLKLLIESNKLKGIYFTPIFHQRFEG